MADQQRYRVVPRTLTFLRRGEQWLLIRRAADRRLWPGLYNGIGGHVEEGEGILASARREVLEEAGVAVDDLRLVGVIHASEGQRGVAVFVFTGVAPTADVIPSAEGSLAWVTLSEALGLDLMPDLRHILPRLQALRPDDPPFLARSTLDATGMPAIVFE